MQQLATLETLQTLQPTQPARLLTDKLLDADSIAAVALRIDEPIAFVSLVASARCQPARSLRRELAEQEALKAVLAAAKMYCGMRESATLPETSVECAELFSSEFSELAVSEIIEAFRLAAARKIDADMSAYYGQFTVAAFGDVMAAYMAHRKRIANALVEAETRKKSAIEQKARALYLSKQAREDILAIFETMCNEALTSGRLPDWKKIKLNWAMPLQSMGAFDGIDIQRRALIWDAARREAAESFSDEAKQHGIAPSIRKKLTDIAESNKPPSRSMAPDLRARAEVFYDKMMVVEAIYLKMN